MSPYLSVSGTADKIREEHGVEVNPRHISELLYTGELRRDLCPLQSGRRLIPIDYVPLVVAALRRRGMLRQEPARA